MYGLKQEGLLANQLLQIAWHLLYITLRVTRLDSGCTKQGQSLSPSSWTILPSNIWASNTLIISEMLSAKL
jgi:hypothetical protein